MESLNRLINSKYIVYLSQQDKQKIKQDLFRAYYDCRKHKHNSSNALVFESHLDEKLEELHIDLISMRYKPVRCVTFIVNGSIVREIFAADFRDRIVHHFIFNRLYPLIERLFIYDSYSCRKAKSTLFGISRGEHFLRYCRLNYSKDCYVLKLDILGFFMHIDRRLLFSKVKHIDRYNTSSDKALLTYLCEQVIMQAPTDRCIFKGRFDEWNKLPKSKSLFCVAEGSDLPVGNLTCPLFANLYLNGPGHFIKRKLKVCYYGLYADDMLLIGHSKEELCMQRKRIKAYLQKFHLDMHHTCNITAEDSLFFAQIMLCRYIGKRLLESLKHLKERIALRGACSHIFKNGKKLKR